MSSVSRPKIDLSPPCYQIHRTRGNKALYSPLRLMRSLCRMSVFTPASEVILRHEEIFLDKHVLFAGDVQDNLPAELSAASVRVHTAWYHHSLTLREHMDE